VPGARAVAVIASWWGRHRDHAAHEPAPRHPDHHDPLPTTLTRDRPDDQPPPSQRSGSGRCRTAAGGGRGDLATRPHGRAGGGGDRARPLAGRPAARVPDVIAWLYPLIIDGLALVASAATGSSGLSRWPYRVESMRKPPPGVQLYPCGVATATPQHVTVASHANIRMPAREFVVPAPRRNE
jgi:hypothetical protein